MRLVVSFPPHAVCGQTVRCFNTDWLLAALPAALAGVYFYGLRAALVLAITTATAMVTEAICQKVAGDPVDLGDRHAALLGLLLGLTLSPFTPWWMAVIGAMAAVGVGKAIFGGVGFYPFHPVLVAYLVLYLSWPELLTGYAEPQPFTLWPEFNQVKSPLMLIKDDVAEIGNFEFWKLFTGNFAGPIGTSAPALILGGLLLLKQGILKWRITLGMFLGLALMAVIYHAINPDQYPAWWWHVFAGSFGMTAVLLGPEPTTTPVTNWGMILFGLGAGLTCFFIRTYAPHPDGAFYGVMVFNAATPILDRIKPKALGVGR